MTMIRHGSLPATARDRMASHWKTPVPRMMLAMTIIPSSRKMTFRSMAAKASSWLMIPSPIMSAPPSSAATVLCTRSLAISDVGSDEQQPGQPDVHRSGRGRSVRGQLVEVAQGQLEQVDVAGDPLVPVDDGQAGESVLVHGPEGLAHR